MDFHELRFLSDENISPKVVTFLRNHGLAVFDVKEQGWQGKSDLALDVNFEPRSLVVVEDSRIRIRQMKVD